MQHHDLALGDAQGAQVVAQAGGGPGGAGVHGASGGQSRSTSAATAARLARAWPAARARARRARVIAQAVEGRGGQGGGALDQAEDLAAALVVGGLIHVASRSNGRRGGSSSAPARLVT